MIPTVTFPQHTQARMAAAKAAKQLKQQEKHETEQPTLAVAPPALPGEVAGLSVEARQTILQCTRKAMIGYGTLGAFIPLLKDVNLAMLDHCKYHCSSIIGCCIATPSSCPQSIPFMPVLPAHTLRTDIPHIVAKYQHITTIGYIILLPDEMDLVTERGVKYVVANMRREIVWGSYATSNFTKNKSDETTCMIRPIRNPVGMIHGLHTLRAFGLVDDAKFLSMPNGPIMTGLERRAIEWSGGLRGLKRFIFTIDRELLTDEDRHLLDRAWAVYNKWTQTQSPAKMFGQKS